MQSIFYQKRIYIISLSRLGKTGTGSKGSHPPLENFTGKSNCSLSTLHRVAIHAPHIRSTLWYLLFRNLYIHQIISAEGGRQSAGSIRRRWALVLHPYLCVWAGHNPFISYSLHHYFPPNRYDAKIVGITHGGYKVIGMGGEYMGKICCTKEKDPTALCSILCHAPFHTKNVQTSWFPLP